MKYQRSSLLTLLLLLHSFSANAGSFPGQLPLLDNLAPVRIGDPKPQEKLENADIFANSPVAHTCFGLVGEVERAQYLLREAGVPFDTYHVGGRPCIVKLCPPGSEALGPSHEDRGLLGYKFINVASGQSPCAIPAVSE